MLHQYGICMYKKPLAVFLVSFRVLYSNSMLSAGMLTISLVFSVGSVVFPVCSLIWDRWVVLRRVGCMVVVLVLAPVFLHVEISVKVVRYSLEMSLVFGARLCWGGGNVTFRFHGNTLSLISALYLWAPVGCDVVGCQWILA